MFDVYWAGGPTGLRVLAYSLFPSLNHVMLLEAERPRSDYASGVCFGFGNPSLGV